MRLKDRITRPDRRNWRTHRTAQADAVRDVLAEIAFADAVLARETPAGLQLLDGHLRAEVASKTMIPVLVVDVTDSEADKILATHDPLAATAETDSERIADLLGDLEVTSEAMQAMLDRFAEMPASC